MWLGSKFTLLSDTLFKSLFKFLFRYDIFISYARGDGKEYALKLRDQLKQLDFSCFLDYDELPPGNALNNTLKRAIKKSAALVIVGTKRAVKSRYVELEVGEFGKTRRAIIPIDIEGTLAETPWPVVKDRDIVWIDEVNAALARGVPSPTVADSIDKLFKYTRRNTRVRAQVLSTMILFVVVVAVSLFMIQQKVKAANSASAEAERQKIEARIQKKSADDATEKATIAEGNANAALAKVAKAEKAASDAAQDAKVQEQKALANAEIARKQQQIAEERTSYLRGQQLGVQADIDIDRGNDLERSVLLSVESLKRSLTPDAAIAWARGMNLLPQAQEVKAAEQRDDVSAISYSLDGRFLAEGTDDGAVTFFRRDKMVEVAVRKVEPASPIKVIRFGKDWVGAASGSGFKTWDLETFAEISSSKSLDTFHGEASIAFSPDGRYVATGESGGGLRLRVVDTIKSATVIETSLKDLGYLLNVDFSPNGRWLAIGSDYSPDDELDAEGNATRSWEMTKGRITFLKVANFEKGGEIAVEPVDSVVLDEVIDHVTFGPKGEDLASEDLDGVVTIWKVADNEQHIKLKRIRSQKTKIMGEGTGSNSGNVRQVFSADESYIATNREHNTVQVWEVSSGREVARIDHPDWVRAIAFSPDGQLATTSGRVNFWKTEFGGEAMRLSYDHRSPAVGLKALVVSPGGEWLVTGNDNGVHVFSTADWSQLAWLDKVDNVVKLTFSSDGRWLVAVRQDKLTVIQTRQWTAHDLTTLPPSNEFPDPSSFDVSILGFSPNGRWLVRATERSVKFFEVGSWRERPIVVDAFVSRLSFSLDSRSLAVAIQRRRSTHFSYPDEMFVWDTDTGMPVGCKDDKESPAANGPSSSQASQRNVCSKVQGAKREVALSEMSTWKEPLEFGSISRTSRDGFWSAQKKDGIELNFNEGKTSRQIATLMQSSFPNYWTFTPDSRWLVIAGSDKLGVWPLKTCDMIDAAYTRLRRRNLTDEERRTYITDQEPRSRCLRK